MTSHSEMGYDTDSRLYIPAGTNETYPSYESLKKAHPWIALEGVVQPPYHVMRMGEFEEYCKKTEE